MTAAYALELLAETRAAELRRDASAARFAAIAARFAAIAACCRSSTWARAAHRALDTTARLRRSISPTCCATA